MIFLTKTKPKTLKFYLKAPLFAFSQFLNYPIII